MSRIASQGPTDSEEALKVLAWSALYIIIHTVAYAIRFRHTTWGRSERGIFLYHALSAVALSGFGLGTILVDPHVYVVAGVVAAMGLHGIYSLSFLELWSLTEGSYSLTILEHVERTAQHGQNVNLAPLECLGESKVARRLNSLQRLGLVRCSGEQTALTYRGRWVADVVARIASQYGPPQRNRMCG